MKKYYLILISFLLLVSGLQGQMDMGGVPTYGNEWIDQSKKYFKIPVNEDGWYRISYEQLVGAGVPVQVVTGQQFQLFRMGQQVPILISTSSRFAEGDELFFYGQKNKGELDQYLYVDPENEHLNPDYSMYNDEIHYYFTWESDSSNRKFVQKEFDASQMTGPESYYIHNEVLLYNDYHHKPTRNGVARIRYSSYDTGEGYGSTLVNDRQFQFPISNVFDDGPDPEINVRFTGNSIAHVAQLMINGEVIKSEGFSTANEFYELKKYEETFDMNLLNDNLDIRLKGMNGANDKYVVANATLSYPRAFDFMGKAMFRFEATQDLFDRYTEVNNFDTDGNLILVDLANGSYTIPSVEEGIVKMGLAGGELSPDYVLINTTKETKEIESIQQVSFVDYSEDDPTYVILSNSSLYNDPETGKNWVQEYADYRSSQEGGSFRTRIVEIEDLYHQFAYGIYRHTLSVKNFGQYIKNIWPNTEYVFILGKGREYPTLRSQEDLNDVEKAKFYIPTFGNPGSDNLLLSAHASYFPSFAVGRLAAQSPSDIALYLNKMRLHENPIENEQTIEDQIWRKRIIHLSGGDPHIQEAIYSNLKSMEDVIEGSTAGADVFTVRKFSADPIQTAVSEEVQNRINAGVSLITFFGHSSTGGFDFSLEDPSRYENSGKFHSIFSLGCLSGNIHTTSRGLSEDFVLIADKSAIAFVASSSSAFISPLANLALGLYDSSGNEMYQQSLGKVVQAELEERSNSVSLPFRTLNEQFTFHGDPAVKLFVHGDPDYVIDNETVSLNPGVISSNLTEFMVNFEVLNLGKSVDDSLNIRLIHELPSGQVFDTIFTKVKAPLYSSMVSVAMSVPGLEGIGKNTIKIELNPSQSSTEGPMPLANENNKLFNDLGEEGFCFYMQNSGARPIFPAPNALININDVTLKASTSNGFSNEEKYTFQIDTTELFNSPMLEVGSTTSSGGLIEWKPTKVIEENMVYYWRVRPDSSQFDIAIPWSSSSFMYEQGESEGWNQSHYFQYLKNDQMSIRLNDDREFTYPPKFIDVALDNKTYDTNDEPRFYYNGAPTHIRCWRWIQSTNFQAGIAVTIGDFNGDYPFIRNEPTGAYGSFSPRGRDDAYFLFSTQTYEDRKNLVNFIERISEYYGEDREIQVFTIMRNNDADLMTQDWALDSLQNNGQNIYNVLESKGAAKIRQMETLGNVHYSIFYSDSGTVHGEEVSIDQDGVAYLSKSYEYDGEQGEMATTVIGPASSWDRFEWDVKTGENRDSLQFNIYTLDALGNETLSMENVTETMKDLSYLNDLGVQYIKLKMISHDRERFAPPQVEFIKVYYQGLPDAALVSGSEDYIFMSDTLAQGDDLTLQIPVENYTAFDMDSLLVQYVLQDDANNIIEVKNRYSPLTQSSTNNINWMRNTSDLSGQYSLTMIVNPDEDQPERYAFNNFGIKSFYVASDQQNPLLDVTFDGQHILDGDLVASTPEIVIDVRDDNKLLLIDDISVFELALQLPSGDLWNVPLDHESLTFEPAQVDDSENKARLTFSPDLKEEGIYRLFAQAKDASGNFSGDKAFEVSFEVINEVSVSNVLNYPNPFSSSTQFVFRLTGKVPSEMLIRIMTMSGKVIKEIEMAELGNVHIGDNITSYRWDGRDEYGQQLANGTYIYQVLTKTEDNVNYNKRNNGTDQFFKKNFGKLVIMR